MASILPDARFALIEQDWGVVLCPTTTSTTSTTLATTTAAGTVRIASPSADPVVPLATPTNGTFRFKDGTHLQFYNETTGLWHTVWFTGTAAVLQMVFGPGEA